MARGVIQVEGCDDDMRDSGIILDQRQHRNILTTVGAEGLVVADHPATARQSRNRRHCCTVEARPERVCAYLPAGIAIRSGRKGGVVPRLDKRLSHEKQRMGSNDGYRAVQRKNKRKNRSMTGKSVSAADEKIWRC